mgnify:CR=1 FL=1
MSHVLSSPFVLSERVGVDNFIMINQEDMTPLSENASIESETPRYFQVDNLYRIDVTEVVYEHHFL